MTKRVLSVAALLMLLVMGVVPTALADDDEGPHAVTMVSGNGSPPGRDPSNEFSIDGGVTWDQAYIVSQNPLYANPIAGSEWISIDASLGSPVAPGLQARYRRFFDLPKECGAAALSVILHVDNDVFAGSGGGVFLNGALFGSTPGGPLYSNFQDPPEGPYTAVGPFKKSGNLLEFRTNDQGVVTGVDYEATLTCSGEDDEDDEDDHDDHDDHGDDNHEDPDDD